MKYIKFFKNISLDQIPLVGGKNAALGQMIQDLASSICIPQGFAITVDAYTYFIQANGISLQAAPAVIRESIIQSKFPQDLQDEIVAAYQNLSKEYHQENLSVAVRSSATTEDLPSASFAGQQESFLHISGFQHLLESIKKCMASLFTDRAVAYRNEKGFKGSDISISVGVQKMVQADDAVSGVMFTLEIESGHPDFITINSAYGLGEAIVGGKVNPDEYMVHKPTVRQGYKPLVKKLCGDKQVKAYYEPKQKNVAFAPVPLDARNTFCLSDDQIFELARYGMIIEDYFSQRKGSWCPMDIEWAQDSFDKKLYIVQARPETVHAQEDKQKLKIYQIVPKNLPNPLVCGLSIGRKIVSGAVKIILEPSDTQSFNQGDILVTTMTDPDSVPLMKIAGGIITDQGGRTCHAAIVARELGVPTLIGTGNATNILKDGQTITLDCSSGSEGMVYPGILPFKIQQISLESSEKMPVHLLVNIANPESACEISLMPLDGAGLVRLEFIIAQRIGIHPMAIAFPEKVSDEAFIKRAHQERQRYGSLKDFYQEVLSQDIGLIAASFYPRPVIVRLTDFKSNEYRNLLGGCVFEPQEENPMIGFRGASRYCDPSYKAAFTLECQAIKRAREIMGLENIIIMVPFVRTLAEAENTLKILAQNGLERGKKGLKIYLMVEIPSNVILLERFAEYFDGFSIGSNDLTQLTLGIDRDSSMLRNLFDENDPAVKILIEQAITRAHAIKKYISICGQAPSDFPEFANWLIAQKIDALSLNSDAIVPFIKRYIGSEERK